jgi:membrane fusion protein (multidrug efflux system)
MKGKGVVVTVVGIGVLLAAAGGAWYVIQKRAPQTGAEAAAYEPMESAQIIEAREIDWQPMADMVGTVIAIRSVAVRNELAGVVREVGYQSGEIVEEGQILLRQDETSDQADLEAVRASVRVAEASVAQARSEIELAKTELERLIGVPSGAIAAVEIDRARNTLETAKADLGRWVAEVDQANARVAQMEARIAKLTIRAPFRARAGLRTVHEGQYLAEGADVVTLQEVADKIYLDFAVPQEYAARIVPGTIVMANGELLGPEPAPIEVVASEATVNNQTRNLRVRAIVNNPGGLLIPGMFSPTFSSRSPVLAIVVNLIILGDRLARDQRPAGAPVPAPRVELDHHHDRVHRRERRDGEAASSPRRSSAPCRDRRHRLHREHEHARASARSPCACGSTTTATTRWPRSARA